MSICEVRMSFKSSDAKFVFPLKHAARLHLVAVIPYIIE